MQSGKLPPWGGQGLQGDHAVGPEEQGCRRGSQGCGRIMDTNMTRAYPGGGRCPAGSVGFSEDKTLGAKLVDKPGATPELPRVCIPSQPPGSSPCWSGAQLDRGVRADGEWSLG